MVSPRVIPVLLLDGGGLVKTVAFADSNYVGDPINACRIFNEKGVDELVMLDIRAAELGHAPDIGMVSMLGTECLMPVAYGGGFRTLQQMQEAFRAGSEKIVLGSALFECPDLITQAAREFGSQSVVVCVDAKKDFLGRYRATALRGRAKTSLTPAAAATEAVDRGAGEVIIQSVDRDGTYKGYDVELITSVSREISVPVVALGGASSFDDIRSVIRVTGVSAAAGSLFVYHGPHRAVLINYPGRREMESLVSEFQQ